MFQSYSPNRRHRGPLVLATGLALLAACQSDSDNETNAGSKASNLLLPADEEILSKAYGTAPRTPPGFYTDPKLNGASASTVHHIDNVDVLDPVSDAAAQTPFELCTDDAAVALAWSELDHDFRGIPGDLVVTDETERYFEFTWARTDLPDWLNHARVFKCGYLDRSGAQAGAVDGAAGRLNARPLNGAVLKAAGEYLWTFSRFNNQSHVVLTSAGRSSGSDRRHVLTLATLTPGAGTTPGCDRVEVRDWELSADAADGTLRWELLPVKILDARHTGAQPERCD